MKMEILGWWKCKQYTQAEMAKMFNVHPAHISRIINGKRWKHLHHS